MNFENDLRTNENETSGVRNAVLQVNAWNSTKRKANNKQGNVEKCNERKYEHFGMVYKAGKERNDSGCLLSPDNMTKIVLEGSMPEEKDRE